MGVLYQKQIADFSAQGLERFFFVVVTLKQTSFLSVCLGEWCVLCSVTVADTTKTQFPLASVCAD